MRRSDPRDEPLELAMKGERAGAILEINQDHRGRAPPIGELRDQPLAGRPIGHPVSEQIAVRGSAVFHLHAAHDREHIADRGPEVALQAFGAGRLGQGKLGGRMQGAEMIADKRSGGQLQQVSGSVRRAADTKRLVVGEVGDFQRWP